MFVPWYSTVGSDSVDAPIGIIAHGIMGSSRNWRSFARRLAEARPAWRWILVDLRCHGESMGASGPHDMEACAEDLANLQRQVGSATTVIGHSFGGKVVLELAARGRGSLQQVWSLDCPPGAAPKPRPLGEVDRVLETIGALSVPIADREVVRQHMLSAGFSAGLAGWMVTNIQRRRTSKGEPDGWSWRFDPDGIQALLSSYFVTDRWGVVRHPADGLDIRLVRGERSDRWSPDSLAMLQSPELAGRVHVLRDAGHWVHVDAAEALLGLIVEHLPPGAPTDG